MQKPVQRTFVIRRFLGEGRSRRGDPFVEYESDDGVVAFWGGEGNLANIRKLKSIDPPFSITCGHIAPSVSYAKRHKFWVPQTSQIAEPSRVATLPVPQSGPTRSNEGGLPSAGQLAGYKVQLVEILDEFEGKRVRDENPVPRIRRLGRTRQIPRTIEPLMLVVAEVRNASLHEQVPPSAHERAAAEHAWKAVREWARTLGLKAAGAD